MRRTRVLSLITAGLLASGAWVRADITVPGADGSDGVFNPTANVEVDLSQAATRQWDQPSPAAGKGVYDPNKWAVIFKYASVDVPKGVTVTFKNHPSRAPVVWLVSGSVTIAGTIELSGKGGAGGLYSEPGPGGWRGGAGSSAGTVEPSGGLGPGGAPRHTYAGYGTHGSGWPDGVLYGNALVLPLLGGSGGGGDTHSGAFALGGGAGGGAIQIAVGRDLIIDGAIVANGGQGHSSGGGAYGGYGSGGAIRLVADNIRGAGRLQAFAYGTNAGYGRIRLEANSMTLAEPAQATLGLPGATATIWPPQSTPTVRIKTINSLQAPAEPLASFDFPFADMAVSTPDLVIVQVECANVPLDWQVKVRAVPKNGVPTTADAVRVSGDGAASLWEASLALPNGFTALQARASKP